MQVQGAENQKDVGTEGALVHSILLRLITIRAASASMF